MNRTVIEVMPIFSRVTIKRKRCLRNFVLVASYDVTYMILVIHYLNVFLLISGKCQIGLQLVTVVMNMTVKRSIDFFYNHSI